MINAEEHSYISLQTIRSDEMSFDRLQTVVSMYL